AEDVIRDDLVTGVQTCALPISRLAQSEAYVALGRKDDAAAILAHERNLIELHNDHHRRERMRTIERGEHFVFTGDVVDLHLRMEIGRASCRKEERTRSHRNC